MRKSEKPTRAFNSDVCTLPLVNTDVQQRTLLARNNQKEATPEVHRPVKYIKSKQRVADHGEVFTSAWLVNAMLDLVKEETERRICAYP